MDAGRGCTAEATGFSLWWQQQANRSVYLHALSGKLVDGGQRDARPGVAGPCVPVQRDRVHAVAAAWKVGAETRLRTLAGTVQLGGVGAPVALTARWTNDYESLLNREATALPGVDVDTADAPGGVEQEDSSVLASARKEQDEYIKEQNAAALQQVQSESALHARIHARMNTHTAVTGFANAHPYSRLAHSQAKGIVSMAKETNAKFGGTFSNGVGSNTWAGTPVHVHAVSCVPVSQPCQQPHGWLCTLQ